MKPALRIFLLIPILITGILGIASVCSPEPLGYFFVDAIHFPSGLLIILTTAAFSVELTSFKLTKEKFRFAVSFIGFLFCGFIFIQIFQRNKIRTSQTLFTASKQTFLTGYSFDFKEKEKVVITDNNFLCGYIYYGKYTLHKGIVRLIEIKNGEQINFPKYGTIINDTLYWNNMDTMLIVKPQFPKINPNNS